VLAGTVDGRGFYLRERHGSWRVTVAPDEDPGSDPWTADPSVPTFDIADGDADRLFVEGDFSVVRALDVAVAPVRSSCRSGGAGTGGHTRRPVSCGVRSSPRRAGMLSASSSGPQA
jgi:hypothetical protein